MTIIKIEPSLTARYEDWVEPPVVRLYFGEYAVIELEPVREFDTYYDAKVDAQQRENIANETAARALRKLLGGTGA